MSIPQEHTVYRLNKVGSFRDLEARKEPIPKLAANQVLIQTKSVTLNYRDLIIANGKYGKKLGDLKGRIPCSDAAGVVVAKGDDVTNVSVGDHVVTNFSPNHLYGPYNREQHVDLGGEVDGTLREYVPISSEAVTKIRKDSPLSWAQKASLVCTGVTVWNALYGCKQLRPGQSVLILGTGGVSLTALAIAKAAGAQTIITSSSDEKLAKIKEQYQPDHTINYAKNPQWGATVAELTGGGVDFVIENGGPGTLFQSITAAAPGGIISLIGVYAIKAEQQLAAYYLNIMFKGLIVRGIVVGSHELSEQLIKFVDSKDLRIHVDHQYNFHDGGVFKAFEKLESKEHVGKIAINFGPQTRL